MRLTVAGLGYVGLTTAGCLADAGNTVFAVDSDSGKTALSSSDFNTTSFRACCPNPIFLYHNQ